MKLNKLAASLALAGLAFVATGAHATPTLTNSDGALSPFGGFDWAAGAVAWTSGFTGATGNTFDLLYAGWAVSILDTTGNPTFDTPLLDFNPNGVFGGPAGNGKYEYTIFATVHEKVVGCTATTCTFSITGGSYDIYYDVKGGSGSAVQTNSGLGAWTGFQDGTTIISGTFDGSANSQIFTASGSDGSNSTTLKGSVTYTNMAYIDTRLVGTTVTSTLQLGNAKTAIVNPTSVDGIIIGANEIKFQADANQSFTVPEPGALLLAGLALAGCGLVSRRKRV